ncbi:nonribosomal peptide synthase [Aspergillus tubingensis]|nr:nonribosomal peptide synthase [Aspergillus tubingensis]
MQRLWAEVLHLPAGCIGINDSFWNLGGNSIRAMKLAGIARRHGLTLRADEIWGASTLEEMASHARLDSLPSEETPAFSLCMDRSEQTEIVQSLGAHQVNQDEIEDIYPCTPLQEGLFSSAVTRPGVYTISLEYELPAHLEVDRFRRAWQATVEANPILRTRIVSGKGACLYQAVIRDNIPWDTRNPSDDVPEEWKTWLLGRRLIRLALSDLKTSKTPRHFTLVIHHALVDGWALPLLLQQVEAAYRGEQLVSRPFSPFVRYLTSQCQSEIDRHWMECLSGLNTVQFPKLPSPGYVPKPTGMTAHTIPIAAASDIDQITLPTRLTMAWALLLSHYTDSQDIVFGVTVAGRGAPVEGIESMTGPTIATIPRRLLFEPRATVIEILKSIQAQSLHTMFAEQAGLQRISRLGAEPNAATQFQSLFVIQADEGEHRPSPMFSKVRSLTRPADISTYGITINAKPSSTSVLLEVTYDPLMVTDVQVERLTHQLEKIYLQIEQIPNAHVEDIESISSWDVATLRKWNGQPPVRVEQCAHELIFQRTLAQPEAPAVCSWDGGLSYPELDSYANNLAKHLVRMGVGPETFVPLYFEKSRWTTVAMLAVLKAGGAFTLLDLSHPKDRLQQICQELSASIAICSEATAPYVKQLGPMDVVILGPNHTKLVATECSVNITSSTPDNAMYVVFTSGSTGKPKGAVITHGSWCTMTQAVYPKLHLSHASRVLQFASHAFDASIFDYLTTLVAGGCVCVPSEHDRMSNLPKAIAELQANWALLTPTVARTISPQTSPSLKHLLLGGEPMTPADVQQWSPYLQLMNAYGPAECAVIVTLQQAVRDPQMTANIGTTSGAVGWVVDPRNVNRLCPVGAVGELLVEGPTIAREYVNHPEMTAEAFVKDPTWMHTFRNRMTRLYRTGDLVQYTDTGEFRFVGRKDTQVKLRGQRVEIGEVEHHLRRCFPGAQGAVADVLSSQDGQAALLAGFVIRTPNEDQSCLILESDTSFSRAAAIALSRMRQALPSYMVPTVLIPLSRLPLSSTGKLDRCDLQRQTARLSREQLDKFRMAEKAPLREPETHTQAELRRLFGVVLSMPEGQIGVEDDFFDRGGDSLSAMKLVALAQRSGYSLTVGDIFTCPRIIDLVARTSIVDGICSGDVLPFSLVPDLRVQEDIISTLQAQANIARDQIEDMYPCTPMQEGLMALTLKSPGKYVATLSYDLVEGVDLDRFQAAWDATIVANPILRTRLAQGPGGSFQVVVREAPCWERYSTQQDYEERAEMAAMGPHVRLLRLSLIHDPPRFVVTIHHALYDGWSLSLLWDQAEAAYRGQTLQPRPFSPFIHYLQQQNDSTAFWRSEFEELSAAVFPVLPYPTYEPTPSQAIHRRHSMAADVMLNFTIPTAIQLAWAIILSYYTDSLDVVFGLTVSGRAAALHGIDKLTGPTVTTVPLRIKLDFDRFVQDEAHRIQKQLTAMTAHEQTGLRNIRPLSSDADKACQFQSHLGILSIPKSSHGTLATHIQSEHLDYGGFASYGFVLICQLAPEAHDHLDIIAQYDPGMLGVDQVQRIVMQFEHILDQIVSHPGLSLRCLSAVSDYDWKEMTGWNATLPPSSESCLHDLVLGHEISRSSALAVCAWDGDLTFEQLASSSLRLSQVLWNSGLQEGSVVPICLEKSKWSVICMVAILRSGATATCIDPILPIERLQSIMNQTKPQVVICSKETEGKFKGHSIATVLTVPFPMQVLGLGSGSAEKASVSPSSPAFIVFTSGSTGRPKGIVMEHRNLSTSIQYHREALNITQNSRMLHFASYAFDASVYEIFTTLVTGGCVCIPFESERMNAIEQFIADKQVNVALLTPSMLAILDPDQVPSLKTVISGGEALTRHVVGRWASRVALINAYGPAETIICAAGPVVEGDWTPGTVGPVLGGAAWVAAPSDPTRLVPLGAVGELIIEGPIVTRGYMNSPELTRAGYIDAPEWLTRFRNGRPGRLYRSGDLVELTTEGTVRFIGRKDTQIKLRGQRIELAEVEYHVRKCIGGFDAIVEIVNIDGSPILFACVVQGMSGGKAEDGLFLPPTGAFQRAMQVAQVSLRDAIPEYMIPSVFLPISKAPQTTGGKIDRNALRKAVEGLWPSKIQRYTAAAQRSHRQPSTAREKAIQAVWAHVLNKSLEMVGVDDSFFYLGGDSISAMQIVSQLKTAGIRTTVECIFQQSTIAKIATTAMSDVISPSDCRQEESCDTPFRLSPIQQLFLDRVPVHYDHFNQSFLFELQRPVQADKVEQAIQYIVRSHPMLRARFSRHPVGGWHQTITKDVDGSYRYEQHVNMTQNDAEPIFMEHQKTLSIENGPLLAVDLMSIHGEKQWLSIIAHHLVVDIVSWQTILDQLERLLGSMPVIPTSTMPFLRWSRLQEEHIASDPKIRDQAAPLALMDYWGLSETSNDYADVDVYETRLNYQHTSCLLGPANEAFRTRPIELLQAALMHAFARTFPDRPTPVVFNEAHGRDPWADDIDVTGTVGWFTNIWPSHVPLDPGTDLIDAVCRTKDGRRDSQDLGRFFLGTRQGKRSNSLFKRAPLPISELVNQGPHVGRFALIDILAEVTDGTLSVQFMYNRRMRHAERIIEWAERTQGALSSLAQRLPTIPSRLTRSDVPLLRLTDGQFSEFQAQIVDQLTTAGKAVEDAYPCAPIQLGMLLSQAKNPQNYTSRLVWTMQAQDEGPIQIDRLMRAWGQVVNRHRLLRTIFVDSLRGDGSIDQVVLEDVQPTIVNLVITGTESLIQGLSHLERSPLPDLHPAHRLTICQSPTGSVGCALDVNHALVDGNSRQIILHDLLLACDGMLPPESDHVYRDYVSYLQQPLLDPARTYWDQYTEGLEPCIFPNLMGGSENIPTAEIGRVDRSLRGISSLREFCRINELTMASVFQVAWGLVLRAYARTEDICYGYMTSGRDTPIAGIEDAVGPFINMLVQRLDFRGGSSTLELLRKCQIDFAHSLSFQYLSLAEVTHRHQHNLFNSIISVQSFMARYTLPHSSLIIDDQGGNDPTEAAFVLDAFEQAVQGIVDFSDQPARSVPLLGGSSYETIRRWNQKIPQPVERCVGDMILDNYRTKPSSPAVCAWDGDFTYAGLETQSARLGRELRGCYGVGPEVFVPIYAIRSRWVTVAITAVIRAGGAFILLDPSHPLPRLRTICADARAAVILAPSQSQDIAAQLVSRVVTFGEELGEAGDSSGDVHGGTEMAPELTPNNALYGIFTSGSTGQPKGVIVHHRAFATSAVSQAGTLKIGPESRVLQFASFAFDAAIGEILTTLVQGGCVCIPSNEQRQQALSRAAYELQANWALLTPSVARALRPADFPTLRTLVLGGEAVSSKEVQIWSPNLDVIVGYGPAECAVWCSGTVEHPGSDYCSLGRPFGCRMWIVEAENPDILVPIGAVGELVVEGPNIARGYLNDARTARAAFLDGPRPWLNGKTSRLFRTGDLARYKADGSLHFVGRKDLQVKLRGQRFELAEVEHHLRQVFDQTHGTLAEVATTCNDTKLLVAYIHLPDLSISAEGPGELLIRPATHTFRSSVQAAQTKLRMCMPEYMVPTLYLPLQQVPLTANGKMDRRRLRDAVRILSLADLEAYSASATTRTKPSTPVEQCLQQIWSEILNRPKSTIGLEDNFFRLGGDSIRAMGMIPAAREVGYRITMANIFNNPRLGDLARVARPTPGIAVASLALAPFALIENSRDLTDTAAEHCGIYPHQIEDIYPCTPLQEGLMALSNKITDRYKVTFRYQLEPQVELEQFQTSWVAIAAINPILRARMIQSDYHPGTFQVVLFDSPHFHIFESQEVCDEHIRDCQMALGNALVDFSLICSRDLDAVQFYLTMHHAVYDGWTLPSLWTQVEAHYRHKRMPTPPPFNQFIEYVQLQANVAAGYWRNEFSGLSAPVWPPLPSARHVPVADASLHQTITGLHSSSLKYTTTTFIHLAWAMVISYQTDSDDIVYGVTLNGRGTPLTGIEDMTGPTFSSFPLRVQLGLDCYTVEDALSKIQQQAADRIPFQHFGLQNIRTTSPEAVQACQFQSYLAIQAAPPSQEASSLVAELRDGREDYGALAEYAFVMVCRLNDADISSMQVIANYDPQVISSAMAKRIAGQFSHILQQLPKNLQTPLNQLDVLSPDDNNQLSVWNRELPSSLDVCLHDLVRAHATVAPDSAAICAWDGKLTYAQLMALSGQLANQLRVFGVHPSALVPLCFEKSKWTAVAMLAVLRAGGACVPLDPGHPPHHIQNIVRRTKAKLILASHKNRQRFQAKCDAKVVTIPLQGVAAQATTESWPAPSCHDVAFVISTSGSTGEPKGILIEHVDLCTGIRDHSPPMRINSSTRALHFASYAFDASIYELFSVLANGGCVCIPSDLDRLGNLAGFIREAQVNFALLTPSVIDRLLRPELVPRLDTIAFGGEAVTQDIVDRWPPNRRLINAYGPAEATICAVGDINPCSWTAGMIGPVIGGVGWVTMPSDVSRLAPVGAVGELVIEGPVVTRGYLDDPERTAAAYISPPGWLTRFRGKERPGRLYRTGDLVQYTDDGGIRFVGRKDTQIKLRGQRIELAHVEYHVRQCFPEAADIIAEIVLREGRNPTLIAFIAQTPSDGGKYANDQSDAYHDSSLFLRSCTSFRRQVEAATARLQSLLPAYMVPAMFLRLAHVPRTGSDKLDRRQLRDHTSLLSSDQIRALSAGSDGISSTSYPPQTARERLLQQLWATVLKIPLHRIGIKDDFFESGGDSIQAMRMVSLLRREGLSLNVSDIFAWPVLEEQACGAREHSIGLVDVETYHPGSLLDIKTADLQTFATRELGYPFNTSVSGWFTGLEVEDILPTTEFQRQFLEHQQIHYIQLHLPVKIDAERLEKACRAIVDKHPMLRSAFLPYQEGYLQVLFRRLDFDFIQISCSEDFDACIERLCVENASAGVAWGTPYFQTLLVSQSPSNSVLIVRGSHAQFDGESMPLIIQDLISVYETGQLDQVTSPSFALYLRHRQIQANPRTYNFWEQYLRDAAMTTLNLSGSDSDLPLNARRTIPLPTPPRGVTMSSFINAAWAVVLAQVTGQRDLVFGHVLNGRDIPVASIHAMSGPCVTVSPIRITIPSSSSNNQVLELLCHVQHQYTQTLPYAGIDFETIRQHATSWPANVSFGSLLTHQNGAHRSNYTFKGVECTLKTRVIGDIPQFHVVTVPLQDQNELIVYLDISSRLGSLGDIKDLLERFCSAIADLDRGVVPL